MLRTSGQVRCLSESGAHANLAALPPPAARPLSATQVLHYRLASQPRSRLQCRSVEPCKSRLALVDCECRGAMFRCFGGGGKRVLLKIAARQALPPCLHYRLRCSRSPHALTLASQRPLIGARHPPASRSQRARLGDPARARAPPRPQLDQPQDRRHGGHHRREPGARSRGATTSRLLGKWCSLERLSLARHGRSLRAPAPA